MADAAADLGALWHRFVQTRDPALRNQLVEAHLNLARIVAATLYRQRGSLAMEFGDYLQFATLGLIEAVDRYDPARGVAFASYASLRIRGAVLNSLESLSEEYQQIDLRRRLRQERLDSLRRPEGGESRDLFARLADVAVGLALSQLLEGSGMVQPDSGHTAAYQQQFYDSARERQLRESLARQVHALPDQERRVVRYHYFQRIDFSEIARLLGLSKGRVSQIHRHALQLLRTEQTAEHRVSRDL